MDGRSGAAGLIVSVAVIAPGGRGYYFGGALFVSTMTAVLVLALWSGAHGPLRALGWGPLVWIGTISYGIYLWHWPITLWLGARDPTQQLIVARRVAAIALTVAAAAVSFYALERPIRRAGAQGHPAGAWLRRPRNVLIAVPVALTFVACTSIAATRAPPPPAGAPVIMMVGDSVPKQIIVPLEKATQDEGWRFVDGAAGGCPASGEQPVDQDGVRWTLDRCELRVVQKQDRAVATAEPDIVVWWDRASISSFLAPDGSIVVAGSDAFWRTRRAALAATVRRLSANGAVVVLVATEPLGKSFDRSNRWLVYVADRYFDLTEQWNAVMRRYAQQHPDIAAYVSITDAVCHSPVTSPCDDAIGDGFARTDGVHYDGPNGAVGVRALIDALRPMIDRVRSDGSTSGSPSDAS